MSKYNVGLKTLLQEYLSETEFYGDLIYKFRAIVGTFTEVVKNKYPGKATYSVSLGQAIQKNTSTYNKDLFL